MLVYLFEVSDSFYPILHFIHSTLFCTSLLSQYLITTGCSEVAVPDSWQDADDASFFVENSYTIVSFCYQIGVFISRSSLSLIKIHEVWVLTLIQFDNLAFWLFQDAVCVLSVICYSYIFALCLNMSTSNISLSLSTCYSLYSTAPFD